LINVDLICRRHDTIIVGDEAGRLLLNCPSQPCIDALAPLYTQERSSLRSKLVNSSGPNHIVFLVRGKTRRGAMPLSLPASPLA
jgi:hypothetical protein